jgi:hypothetical protein
LSSDITSPNAPNSRTLEQRLWRLESEQAIRDVIHRNADRSDRREFQRSSEVFHRGATRSLPGVHSTVIPQDEHNVFAAKALSAFQQTHHLIGTVEIRIDGERAVSQAYFTATHLVPARSPLDFLPENRRPPSRYADEELIWWVGGRYFDELEHRNGQWGIVHRTQIHDWEFWAVAVVKDFENHRDHLPQAVDERLRTIG